MSSGKEKKGREGMRSFQCSREDKGGAQKPRSGRDRRRVDALAGVHAPVWASEHSAEHRRGTVCSFNDFSSSLTS